MITLIVGEMGVGKSTIAKAIQAGMQQEGWIVALIDLKWPEPLNLAKIQEIQKRAGEKQPSGWLVVLEDRKQWTGPYDQLITLTMPGDSNAT